MKKILAFIFIFLLIVLGVRFFLATQSSNHDLTKTSSENIDNMAFCKRKEPYKMNPEFERGLSLLYQRIEEHKNDSTVQEELKPTIDTMLKIRNCLNIQFSESNNDVTEGFFVFDPNSSTENLEIFVNKKYSAYDDALTALLLAHEVTHAVQLVDSNINAVDKSCIDKEIESIRMEYRLLRSFTYAENTSITSRISHETETRKNLPSSLQEKAIEYSGLVGVSQLLEIQEKMLDICNSKNENKNSDQWVNIFECAGEMETDYIREYITNNPFYIEQCNL